MSKRVGGKWKSVKQRLHLTSPYIEDFKSWLRDSGYKTTTIEELVRLLASSAEWIHAGGFMLDTILAGFDASTVVFRGSRTGNAALDAGALFIRHLHDRALVPRPRASAFAAPMFQKHCGI
jgi:hypothetical protein